MNRFHAALHRVQDDLDGELLSSTQRYELMLSFPAGFPDWLAEAYCKFPLSGSELELKFADEKKKRRIQFFRAEAWTKAVLGTEHGHQLSKREMLPIASVARKPGQLLAIYNSSEIMSPVYLSTFQKGEPGESTIRLVAESLSTLILSR